MKIRYYVYGFGYDENDRIFDPKKYLGNHFGDFDTPEEARVLFEKLKSDSEESFFINIRKEVYRIRIQLEKCEEDDNSITCIDVIDEFCVTNPNFIPNPVKVTTLTVNDSENMHNSWDVYWVAFKNGLYISGTDEFGYPTHTKDKKEAFKFYNFDTVINYFKLGYAILKE